MGRILLMTLTVGAALPLAGSAPMDRADAVSSASGLFMGELVGRDARVAVFATDVGTRFEIRTRGGRTVAAGLTAREVAQLLPGQDPQGVLAQDEAPVAIMLAEPRGMPDSNR